jgi:hypothetical protein
MARSLMGGEGRVYEAHGNHLDSVRCRWCVAAMWKGCGMGGLSLSVLMAWASDRQVILFISMSRTGEGIMVGGLESS